MLLLPWDTKVAWITLPAPFRGETLLAPHITAIVKVHPVLVVKELTLFSPPVSLPQEKLSAAAFAQRQVKAGLQPLRIPLCMRWFDTLLNFEFKRLGKEVQRLPRILEEHFSRGQY